MAIKYGNSIDLDGFEIQNFVIQNLASAPAISKGGAMYWNTSDQNLKLYDTEGTSWFNVVQGTNLSTDKGIVVWDGIKGKRLYDSQITIDETGPLTGLINSIPVASVIKDYVDTEISGITIPVYTASAGITKVVNDFSLDFATLSNQTTMLNDDAFVFRKDSTGVHYNIKLSDLITLVGGGGGTGGDGFKTWILNSDSGFTWGTNNLVAEVNDVLRVVYGTGILLATDSVNKAIKISADTSYLSSNYLKLDQSSQQTIIGGPLVDFIDFNTAYSGGHLEGRLHWNTDDGTLEVGMPGGNVVLQIGQENLIRVNNEELVTIPNGTVVYASSSSGNIKYVKIASYDDGIDANRVVGVATEDILSGQFGYITTFGLVRDIPLDGFIGGQNVYLGLNGSVQSTRPAAPYKSIVIGIVVRPHLTEGELYVKIKSIPTYSEVNAIGDPGTSVDREILIWDGTTGNQVRVNTGAAISSLGHMTVSGDVIAYASGSPMSSFWDDMPKATETTMGGFKFYTSQFEWTGVGNDQLKIKDSVLVPAEHEHSWQDITSGTQPAPVAHELTGSLHAASGLTAGHFLKATGLTTFAFEAHGLTYSDVGAIASPGVSVDREILIWNGITGNAVRTSTGAVITTEGHMTVSGDVIAYSSGSPSSSFWDDMPKATETTMGGFMFYPSQFEWTGPDNAQLKIKDSVLVPASHTHAWTDITSVPDNLTSIIALAYTTPSFVKMTGVNTFSLDTNTYSLTTHNHAGVYQPLSTNLTSLADLTYSSTAFVKMTALGTFTLDTNTYSLDGHTHTNMVDYTGTPLTNQIAYFLDNNTIQGNANFTFNGTLVYLGAGQLSSGVIDGVSAIGFKLSTPSYSTAGAKLVSILNNTTEKLSLDKDGTVQVTGDVIAYSSGTPSSFTTDSFKTWTVQSDSGYTWGSSDLVAAGMDIVDFVAGSGITITTDSTLKAIKIAVTSGSGMVYPSAGIAVSTGTSWGSSITDNSTNWNTAYSWGDHSLVGYLTSYTETDPVFNNHIASSIVSQDITNWNTAYGWGDHSIEGYLTSYTETDPIFTASAAYGITNTNITNWNTAYGWGDHSTEGYLTSFTETDPVFTASAAYNITSTNISNWNAAYNNNHVAVSIGTANGLSLATQTLSLALATTGSAGAMSASDKSFLNNLNIGLFTLKSNDVEDGINISQGNTLTIQGSDNIEVSRNGSTLTISADIPSGGITSINGGIGIDVTGSGNSRTISVKIDNDTIIIDELNNQMIVDSSKYATSSHLHTGVYEPVFTKNTAFNKDFGTTSGTVAEGNHTHTQLHSAVSLGTANGLSLDGQELSLSVATTITNGAMSASDKIKLNGIQSNAINQTTADGRYSQLGHSHTSILTIKGGSLDAGEALDLGDTLVFEGSGAVEVSRTNNVITIDANVPSGGITTINEGSGIMVTGTGSSRTIETRIDEDTIIYDPLDEITMKVDTSKIALKTDLHSPVSLGVEKNGLSLTGQSLELTVASTLDNGAMAAADKTKLDSVNLTHIANGQTAYGWGNHATVGYLISYTETDPVFTASAAAGITSTNINNWNAAHSSSHSAVTIGTANGLSLDGQQLSLAAATTNNAGAMSTADKIKLNNSLVVGANLFTLKNSDVDVGEPISQGGSLIIKAGDNVTVDRTDNELTIDAIFNGLTSINEGSGIAVSGSGSSRTVAARIGSNMTWVADGSNNAIDIDTSKVALKTDLHNAVTLGIKPNGLIINSQVLELNLATTSNAGAMSANDKTFLNNLSSSLFTLKSNSVEDGIDITAGDTVTIQGSDNVEVSRSGSTLTITAGTSGGGITTLSGGIAINVTGSGSSRTISAKVDNDTIIIDELNNQMMVDSSKLALATTSTSGAMSAAHYNKIEGLPSTFVGGSGTSGYVPRFTPNGSTLGNSSIRDNGSSISVGTSPSSSYKIYAYANNTNASIRGYNASTLSGSIGVVGEANSSGQGYLSRYDGTRRAAIYGVVGAGSGTKYAGYFSGDILTTGDVYSNSDIRLKKNIKPIENPLQRLMEINPVAFKWIDDKDGRLNYGVIAQELQNVFPELVANDGQYLTVRYQELIGVAVAALQEQQKQIELQDKRMNSLEKRLKKLENGTSNK